MESDLATETLPSNTSRYANITVGVVALLGIVVTGSLLASKLDYEWLMSRFMSSIGSSTSGSTHQLSSGTHHKSLQMFFDISGWDGGQVAEAGTVKLDEVDPVIGVEFRGKSYAFALNEFIPPTVSVVNFTLEDGAVSVVYCKSSDRIRVLTDEAKDRIPLGVGGLDVDNQLVVQLDGERFSLDSPALPLRDLPFERTTWGEWSKTHNASKIWASGASSYAKESSQSYGR